MGNQFRGSRFINTEIKMKLIIFILGILLLNYAEALVVTGKAYSENKIIYVEKHFPIVLKDGSYQSLKTEYFFDNGKKFADISSDFSLNQFVPNVIFKDERFNLLEYIKWDRASNMLLIEREINNKKKSSSLEIKSASILGQGFHNFIVKNFDNILKSEVDVYFIITSKSDQFHFKMYLAKKTDKEVIIKGKIDNFFLRAFVEEIELTYALPDKRLLRFKGLSNLDNNQGNSQNVDILYEYEN